MGRGSTIMFLLHVIFGLYFINFAFAFITLPEIVSASDKWVFLIGGILIFLGGFNFLRLKGRKPIRLIN